MGGVGACTSAALPGSLGPPTPGGPAQTACRRDTGVRAITEVVNGPSAECVKSYPRGSFAFRSAIKVVPMEFSEMPGSNKGTVGGARVIRKCGFYCGGF